MVIYDIPCPVQFPSLAPVQVASFALLYILHMLMRYLPPLSRFPEKNALWAGHGHLTALAADNQIRAFRRPHVWRVGQRNITDYLSPDCDWSRLLRLLSDWIVLLNGFYVRVLRWKRLIRLAGPLSVPLISILRNLKTTRQKLISPCLAITIIKFIFKLFTYVKLSLTLYFFLTYEQ